MKNPSLRRPLKVACISDVKNAIRKHYQLLEVEMEREFNEPTQGNWSRLFELHARKAELERRAPWLKQEVR